MAKNPKAPVRKSPVKIETLTHSDATRKNIPTAEYQSVMDEAQKSPLRVAYERRNKDLDPQLVWRGKDLQDWSDLVVHAPPLYIQEKIHPKVLIDDLKRFPPSPRAGEGQRFHPSPRAGEGQHFHPSPLAGEGSGERGLGDQIDLFADFNGIPDSADKTDFYQHDAHWANRMILGDSLQVMASLAEREGLRGQVQCIYFDPPYGIKFNSNFQWSTTSRDVKDGNADHITREPEQVKAFRDTWRDGIHSYLTYLRDRLTVARDLLTDSGSIFVQIGDENVHRVRAVMDEVFGDSNFVVLITFQKTGGIESNYLSNTVDYVLWYAKNRELGKFRRLMNQRKAGEASLDRYDQYQEAEFRVRALTGDEKKDDTSIDPFRRFQLFPLYSDGESEAASREFGYSGEVFSIRKGTHWKTTQQGLTRIGRSDRIEKTTNTIRYKRFVGDVPMLPLTDRWESTQIGTERTYVVQTASEVVKRCILMTTDPGDLVLDPTCGSGTTAYVAEQWGRRWITLDTSRVALALARARIMGARYPYYLLADSPEGRLKEAEITRRAPPSPPAPLPGGEGRQGSVRQGFVYERVPHITLKSIANNAEIDVIWDKWQQTLEPLREQLNAALGRSSSPSPLAGEGLGRGGSSDTHPSPRPSPARGEGDKRAWEEWQIPRELPNSVRAEPVEARPSTGSGRTAPEIHADWWQARIARQQEIDASIAAQADSEYLYDKPYADNRRVRVAGPFTVESLSPHRVLGVDENDELIDPAARIGEPGASYGGQPRDFVTIILENLRTAGVQQAHKDDRISFTSLVPWPGDLVCAEGRYVESAPSPQPLPHAGGGANAALSPGETGVGAESPLATSGTGTGAKSPPSPGETGPSTESPVASRGTAAGAESPLSPRGRGAGGEGEKRAAIFIGPEFGTVSRPDLVEAAREAGDAGFDVL
ncbi:MAG: site-specific DNA-methyltransferase, partial [Porticoccaceae bacterium]